MSRFFGIFAVMAVVLLAMGFAAANAGSRATIDLGLLTLHRVPVTLVAFTGLLTGMVVMFATGVYTDLKVRRILRERLAEEAHQEQRWIDGNQQDLFAKEEAVEAPLGTRESLKAPAPDPDPISERPAATNEEDPIRPEEEISRE